MSTDFDEKLSVVSSLTHLLRELLDLDLSSVKSHALKVNKTMNQKAISPICTVYVSTDFDTIEKALSGPKRAKKGVKQGLPRSIHDFGGLSSI